MRMREPAIPDPHYECRVSIVPRANVRACVRYRSVHSFRMMRNDIFAKDDFIFLPELFDSLGTRLASGALKWFRMIFKLQTYPTLS